MLGVISAERLHNKRETPAMTIRRSERTLHTLAAPRGYSPIAAAVLAAVGGQAALAQDSGGLEEVVVTAQKRTENMQDVPISIEAIGTERLEQLNISNFTDYVKMLPSVASQPSIGAGAGFSAIYMRGIVTGGDGQATTSQPSVGTYLDEQPITTIQGNLDMHLYDIARVEVLAGPQGTLYGASSQAGTIRIITNKPEVGKFAAGYSLEGNTISDGGNGYTAEGFVNIPLSDRAAVRLVGWKTKKAGWIDNVRGTRLYPGDVSTAADNFTVNNNSLAKDDYNTLDTMGARAALRIELDDNWTITPTAQMQDQESNGSWGDDLSSFAPGTYAVKHFREEYSKDKWYQLGLTVEGQVGSFDLTYSGNYLNRDVDASFDYSDYSYWYDNLYTSGYFAGLFLNNAGGRPNPAQSFINNDAYSKQSHELRLSSDPSKRLRGLLGFFYQKQVHDFEQPFGNIAGLADAMLMNRDEPNGDKFPGVVYLNSLDRVDTDKAVFGQLAYDITDSLELTIGARFFKPEVTVKGFFGYGLGFSPASAPSGTEPGAVANGGSGAFSPVGQGWSRNGEYRCKSQKQYKDAPCQNVDKGIAESENIGRVNLRWKATEDAMLYLTWSEGYRPGGINRNPFAGDYVSDFLTNYEFGWKTTWADNRLQFNGALFLQKWDDFQISFQGANGITQVDNGPSAEVNGLETQLQWLPTDDLLISASAAFYDSELKNDYKNTDGSINAPKGTTLPITPKFKGNLIARYGFELGSFEAHVQGAVTHAGKSRARLRLADYAVIGDSEANTMVDLSAGLSKDNYSVELFVQNAGNEDAVLYKTSQCADSVCGVQPYGIRPQPRTIGLKFTQKF
jgi:outer membrane receptor protein involved in Fe transport